MVHITRDGDGYFPDDDERNDWDFRDEDPDLDEEDLDDLDDLDDELDDEELDEEEWKEKSEPAGQLRRRPATTPVDKAARKKQAEFERRKRQARKEKRRAETDLDD